MDDRKAVQTLPDSKEELSCVNLKKPSLVSSNAITQRAGQPLGLLEGFCEAREEASSRWPEQFREDSWDIAAKWIPYPTPKRVSLLYVHGLVQLIEGFK